jgi:putative chitinase
MNLTLAQLKQLIPGNPYPEQWYHALEQLLPDYDINTPKRIAAFIAQCAHESTGRLSDGTSAPFVALTENLNYKPATLRKVFPKYFPDDAIAASYCAKPYKAAAIANRVYANRMGNGDEASGDGFRYCGRGLIQLTGKSNYQAFADSLQMKVEDVPDYLATFEGAAQSACWFWETNNLNKWADAGDIKELTRRINGGFIGLDDRIKHYEHALQVLTA